jgi:CubicO group peptidase (beta-lactamase class C family)
MGKSRAVNGVIAPGFEIVADEFERNFTERGELGAAFAAYRGSESLLDLWGGIADRSISKPWQQDTLQVVFSGTKGLVAVCILILIERGELELDAPVAHYWPEFAAHQKSQICVRDVVSHTAGLPTIAVSLEAVDALDPERMAEMLAAQASLTPTGQLYYHSLTFGWLCDALIRRTDGRSAGRFFAEEVADPLELEIWIGLPSEEEHRVATLELASNWGANPTNAQRGESETPARANPPLFERELFPWNSESFHRAEIAGAGAIGSARSIARLYACLAAGGALDGVRVLQERTLRLGRTELARGHEPVVDVPLAFGVGFELQTHRRRLGPPEDAYGHTGAGGSVHGAWPTEGIGFSYAMNLMRDSDAVDGRPNALLQTLYRAAHR